MQLTVLHAVLALSLGFVCLATAAPSTEYVIAVSADSISFDTSAVPDDVPVFFEDGTSELVPLESDIQATADIQAYLRAHNIFRAKHGARPLEWDNTLANKAQQWANRCEFKHSGGSLGPYGENLAAGTGNGYTIESAIKSWTDEAPQYNARNPQPSHFTQVVWKSSQKLGCAVADCNGIFPPKYGKAHFHVCEYFPAGNVIGRFPANVQP